MVIEVLSICINDNVPYQPPQDGETDPNVFVAFIAGQQSTDPSPAGPPAAKGRRLKLAEEVTAAVADEDKNIPEPAAAAAATTKRAYNRRKWKIPSSN